MSDTKLGQLLGIDAKRDAIHIAIAPVISSGSINPGEHIGFTEDGTVGIRAKVKIGIADPFLKNTISNGERFYMFLYPNTVTGMRHEWSHPDFQENKGGDDGAKRSLTLLAERCGCSFELLMLRLDLYAAGLCGPNDSIQQQLNLICEESFVRDIWSNYEICRGVKVGDEIKGETFFRCTC